MPIRKYTDDQLDQAAEMRESGMFCSAIAAQLGMSSKSVHWHCLRLGADSPIDAAARKPKPGPQVMKRSGHVVRRFSAEEDERLVEMDLTGASLSDMARALGRKHNSVRGRLMTLARKEAREEMADA